MPDPCGKGELSKINTALQRFFKRLKAFKKYGKKYVSSATLKVQKLKSLIKSTQTIIAGALKSLMQKVRNWLLRQNKNKPLNEELEYPDMIMASDAFFPFKDNIEEAKKFGVKYITQPGGSIRDNEVIEECNKKNMVMLNTGIRLFTH